MSPIERSGGGGGAAAAGLVLLFTSTLGVAAASIDTGAGGIPGGHKDLFMTLDAATVAAVIASDFYMRFNNDSGANYDWCWIRNTGGGVGAVDAHADTGADVSQVPGTTVPANYASPVQVSIPNYDATTLFKNGATIGGSAANIAANERVIFASFVWRNTAAITRVAVFASSGNLAAGSSMTIYGTQ